MAKMKYILKDKSLKSKIKRHKYLIISGLLNITLIAAILGLLLTK